MPLTRRNPMTIPAIMMAAGLSVGIYYGDRWYRWEAIPEGDLHASVELNLAVVKQARGPHLPMDPEREQRLRETIREELVAESRRPLEQAQARGFMGLGVFIIGFGQWLFVTLLSRQTT
jgi:hypothetical protein